MELARVKRDLAELKMQRVLLKKRRPTSRRNRGEVWLNGRMAAAVPGGGDVPCFWRIRK